jgi:FHA domain
MKLELSLENSNHSWPLTPDKSYIIGSDTSCDFTLPLAENVRGQHLKFSFDQANNCWLAEDLSGRRGTIVNNMLVAIALIKGITRIVISDEIVLIATPEFATAPPVAAPIIPAPVVAPTLVASAPVPAPAMPNVYVPNPNLYNSGYAGTPTNGNNPPPPVVSRSEVSSGISRASAEELRVLTWAQYVQKQSLEHGKKSLAMDWIINFALKTGFRNTPWMKDIDGYIIPNFKGSAESVSAAIEKEVGLLRQYEETDCYISSLTDAHIADSGTQSFLGVELFPIIRSRHHNKGDYRKFCITAYHRIRTYLLVEKYGNDLFVSWITRFEPTPSPVGMTLFLVIALLGSVILLFSVMSAGFKGLIFATIPMVLWWSFFYLTPWIMSSLKILPKKANAKLVIGLLTPIILISILLIIAVPGGDVSIITLAVLMGTFALAVKTHNYNNQV